MIGGLVLAAGQSKRMGRPKLSLPWKDGRSVVGHLAHVLREAGAELVVVVTGGDREEVEAALGGEEVLLAHNPDFAAGEMLSSVKVGLRAMLATQAEAALIAPGDHPGVAIEAVAALIAAWRAGTAPIVAPSHAGRRGHPILVGRAEWEAILALPPQETLRDYLAARRDAIHYVVIDDPGVLRDMDTPEEYLTARQG